MIDSDTLRDARTTPGFRGGRALAMGNELPVLPTMQERAAQVRAARSVWLSAPKSRLERFRNARLRQPGRRVRRFVLRERGPDSGRECRNQAIAETAALPQPMPLGMETAALDRRRLSSDELRGVQWS